MKWAPKTILVTGGTGSFGKKFVEVVLREHPPKRLIIFSRDELKQSEMRLGGFDHSCLRYFIGDVRDANRLRRAMSSVDIVVHAAAMKQVPACEYNPFEAIKTNILGAQNVITAAIECGVQSVIALSSDKAVEPVNLYGATKLVAEKLFIQGNVYSGKAGPRFSCVRYGNVIGSRGSVIPLFLKQIASGIFTITDKRMTRFWLTLDQAVHFVIDRLEDMVGGEVFVPKIPSMRIVDLARAIVPEVAFSIIGIRPGEKLHEILVSRNESLHTQELEDMFVIRSSQSPIRISPFEYTSDTNNTWLTPQNLRDLIV